MAGTTAATIALAAMKPVPGTGDPALHANPRIARLLLVVAVLAVAAAATFLRVWRIDAVGFNGDEAIYAGQAASIADNADLKPYFPIFRAHPLLFQSALSLSYRLGGGDMAARLFATATGIATVYLVYAAGRRLYGLRAGLCSALFMALMPYHVVVSRQVLLDAPMVLFATLTLYAMARFGTTGRPFWLYASGTALGLTIITKETGVILISAVYAFLALSPSIRVRLRDIAISVAVMVLTVAPFPLAVLLSGRSNTGHNYLTWQLFRRPNHGLLFYPETVTDAMGYVLVAAAVLGLWLYRHNRSWREVLLLSWIAVNVAFFELWPVKGFQYLLPIAPAVAILAGRTVGSWTPGAVVRIAGLPVKAALVAGMAIVVIAASLALPAWNRVQPSTSDEFLAGSGGVPGGREAGHWVGANVPEGARMLALGPSMANIIQFYGHRKAYGLSVSPNPLHRNPSYEAVTNPDRALRNNEIQYLVWDAYSAARSPFFSEGLLRYVARYHGTLVHQETVRGHEADGTPVDRPVISIYEVRP